MQDIRTRQFLKVYGAEATAVELDALEPKVLQDILITAIHNEINIEKFKVQKEIQDKELGILSNMKDRKIEFVNLNK